MDSLSLLQGIFPTQGSNPGLPHCRQILYQLSHQGSLRILEWVVYPFSRGSSWPRNWTRVSCIASIFFTSWATREAHERQTSKVLAYLGQNNFPAVSLTLWTTATLFWSQQTTVSLAVESVGFGIMQTWYWPCLSYSVLLHGIFIQTYMSLTHRGPCEECTLTTAFEANVDLRFHSRNQEGIHIMPPKVINVSISDIYHLPNPFLAFLDIMIFSLSFIQCPASLTPFLSTLSLFIFSSILLHRWVPSRSPAQQHKNFTR